MIFAVIGSFILSIIILIIVFDLVKKYRKKNFVLKCNICGSLNTEIKNNDVEYKWYSYDVHTQGWQKSIQHNPPSFFCNNCKKEYDIKQGTFVKKSKLVKY